MKKTQIFFLLMLAISAPTWSQSNAQSRADSLMPAELEQQVYIYSLANKYNDPAVSKIALYNILAMTPGNTIIMDSLAVMYLEFGQYASAALISQDILRINPNDMFATEIAAISFETLGVKDRALTYYEKLYLNNSDLGMLYQVSYLQYELKRFNESIINADIIINDSKSETFNMFFPLGQNDQQEINMKAAAYRLKGLIAVGQNKTSEARQFYTKAIEFAPTFEVAKSELASLPK